MCGIAGFIGASARKGDAAAVLASMTDSIRHRGPDDEGAWLEPSAGVALGHRRLSIVDLSQAGHQPMSSRSGRFVIVYNGEIYNHRTIRAQIDALDEDEPWRGHSDTEVLLAAVECWGIAGALRRADGMFALAIWDRDRRTLTLARDRLGEKPLYYGAAGADFLFGSELKALRAFTGFSADVDRAALTGMLRYGYVPGSRSIWQGISKLQPGHYIELCPDRGALDEPRPYWDYTAMVAAAGRSELAHSDAVSTLEDCLRAVIGEQMEADVPLGAFLSGGVDSSLVTALMQTQASRPVRTFTIGFSDPSFDEAAHARSVAEHLATDHTELYVTPADALALVPDLPRIWDEPFADSSQIPTYFVSAMARDHVTVALSGDGGDEVFGGYNRYVAGARIWDIASRLPLPARRMAAGAMASRPGLSVAALLNETVPAQQRHLGFEGRFAKFAGVLGCADPADFYEGLVSVNPDAEALLASPAASRERAADSLPDGDLRLAMMATDTRTYLPDDILVKVDRASMAASLETRAPFLDRRVVELAWSLPIDMKIRHGKGKAILRDILDRYVPRALIERPKSGFAVPMAEWLRGPLREWAEDLLDERRIREEGYLDSRAVHDLWARALAGAAGAPASIWCVLMFQAWLRVQQASTPQTVRFLHHV